MERMQLGHYQLLHLIGSGGMGEVYLAEDTRIITRQVAIKVVRTEVASYPDASTAKEAERRFLIESGAIAALDHPHILPLFDFGEEEERVTGRTITYMVMPFRREGSLADWLQQRKNAEVLSPEEVLHFTRQAADALQYAHEHQLIHQDVKQSNFLIRERAEYPKHPDLLLVDFGIAKFTNASTTIGQSIRGTPAFMAPEQWDGRPVPATDQYALAIMAYQLLTGHTPFKGRNEQVMWQHFHIQPKAPSKLNTRISPAIDAVILRALAKKAEERFDSIADFSRAFEQALHGQQNTWVAPPSIKSKVIIRIRNKKVLLPTLIAIILLILGSVGLIINKININHFANLSIHNTTDVSATSTATFNTNKPSFNPYTPNMQKLVLNDPLTDDNKGYGWEHYPMDSYGGACQFAKDGYHVIEQQQYVNECHTTTTQFGSFTFEVQMKIVSGNCGGITFRDDMTVKAYHFEVCQDGTYQLYRYDSSTSFPTLTSGSSSFIKIGLNQSNLIAIVALDNKFDLYVNRQYIANTSDDTYHQGYIGLQAAYYSSAVEVIYSNAKAWTP